MLKAFTQHPRSVGESYFEHLGQASSVAGSEKRRIASTTTHPVNAIRTVPLTSAARISARARP